MENASAAPMRQITLPGSAGERNSDPLTSPMPVVVPLGALSGCQITGTIVRVIRLHLGLGWMGTTS